MSAPTISGAFIGGDPAASYVAVAHIDPAVMRDSQYFENDPARPVQLRPRLKTDRTAENWKPVKGEMILATRGVVPALRCYIRPPRSLRANSPEAVEWCIRWLERNRPMFGRAFRSIANGEIPGGFDREA